MMTILWRYFYFSIMRTMIKMMMIMMMMMLDDDDNNDDDSNATWSARTSWPGRGNEEVWIGLCGTWGAPQRSTYI